MTPPRRRSAVIEFPNHLEIVLTRQFDAVTTLTWRTAFKDKAGRARMTTFDGIEANFDNVEDLLWSVLDAERTGSGG